jgi:hypothetical protein
MITVKNKSNFDLGEWKTALKKAVLSGSIIVYGNVIWF